MSPAKICFGVIAMLGLPVVAHADVIRDQSQIVTHPAGGAAGADESRLQTTTFGMGTIGFGAQQTVGNVIADDFTVNAPFEIQKVTVYSYQTGSTTTSTFTGFFLQIFNGPPNNGGTVVCGDLVTNRIDTTATTWSGAYRVTETAIGNTQRPIMRVVSTPMSCSLTAGTYWLAYQLTGSLASGPWVVPVTILGVNGAPGANALQFVPGAPGAWNAMVDGGTGNPPQEAAFRIEGRIEAADLQVAITNNAEQQLPGQQTIYTVIVANNGPRDMVGATFSTSSSGITPGAWICTPTGTSPCPASNGSGELNATVSLLSGDGLRFDMVGTVVGASGTNASRQAVITSPVGLADTDTANNSATDTDAVVSDGLFAHGFEDPAQAITNAKVRSALGLD